MSTTPESRVTPGVTVDGLAPALVEGQEAAIEALRRAVLAPDGPVQPGDVLDDRYVLGEVVGRGGMGVVWKAHDRRLGRDVAVKILAGNVTSEQLARMRREARAVAQLAHPNVVPVYDVGLHGARPYLVMEFIRGTELRAWLRTTPSPHWRAVLAAFVGAGRGLVAAHDAGLVHRDFKPANVLIGDDGRARVVDFGLARNRDDLPSETPGVAQALTDATITASGVALGTPAYMAPEQHEGEDATTATDTFGFAIALYEGLYGERPYAGANAATLLASKRAGPPSAPPRSPVPRSVFDAVVRGLAPEAGDRWPSMRAFVDALSNVRRPWRSSILVGALAALGVAAWLELPAPKENTSCRTAVDSFRDQLSSRRQALADRLVEAEISAPVSRAVAQALEDYETVWTEARHSSCDPEQADRTVPALRVERCLERSQRATLRQLEAASASTEAAQAFTHELRSLPNAADCTDRVLAGRQPLPDEPSARRAVEDLSDWASRFRIEKEVRADLEHIPERLAQAQELGHLPTAAEVAVAGSLWADKQTRYELAEDYCTQAHAMATEGGADRIAMQAAMECVTATAWRGDLEAARRWNSQAQALSERIEAQPWDRVEGRADLAVALVTAGETDEARSLSAEVFAEVLALRSHDRASIHTFTVLGMVSNWLGDYDEAIVRLQAGLDKASEYYPGNDNLVFPAEGQLGAVYRSVDRYEDSERMLKSVLQRRIPPGTRLDAQLNLANTLGDLPARRAEAALVLVTARQGLQAAGHKDTMQIGAIWEVTGHLERKSGHAQKARAAYNTALSIYGKHLEPGHARMLSVERGLSNLPAERP